MFILGLVGSPRKNGRTNELVDAALEGVRKRGVEARRVYLADYDVKPFMSAGGSDEGYRFCPPELSDLCETAAALVVGAPVYWGDINGLTKDWMDTVRIREPQGKPGLGIAIAGGTGKGLLSGVQSIYHWFYHKQMRGIDPTPVSRFNYQEALAQLGESGSRLADLAMQPVPFRGEDRDDRWGEVLAYYSTLPYLNCDPLDEFVMLAEQLIRTSKGSGVEQAQAELDQALVWIAEGERSKASPHAYNAYRILYSAP